jgi:hypothetical protein
MLTLESMLLLVIGTGLGVSFGPAGVQIVWLVAVMVFSVVRAVRQRREARPG